MDTDLHQIIRSNQPLSDEHVQYFLYQAPRRSDFLALLGFVATSNFLITSEGAARTQIYPFCGCAPSRPQAVQPAVERELRPQNLRLWTGTVSPGSLVAWHGVKPESCARQHQQPYAIQARTNTEKGFMTEYVVTRW